MCRSCGYRFSEPKIEVDVSPQSLKSLNSESNLFDTNVAKGDFPIKEGFDSLSFQRREDVASHVSSKGTIAEKGLNTFRDYSRNCRVCASEAKAAKNLVTVETRFEKRAAGATTKKPDEATTKGLVAQYAYHLEKEGYYENSAYLSLVRLLAKRGANLLNLKM